MFFPGKNGPTYVIAFRGTLNKPDSISRDIELDLLCIRHKLHKSSRFRVAMQAVHDVISVAGPENLWLAGHSLGSAIAMLAGKKMAKGGTLIETYLFNPPFLSAPIERIKNKKIKQGIRFTSGVVKAGLVATESQDRKTRKESEFAVLSTWSPYMFLNPSDHICAGYIGYFEHRRRMEERGAGKIEQIALTNSVAGLLSGSYSEPLHLVPSAHLTVNSSHLTSFKKAHGIHQWWNPDHCFCSAAFLPVD
ncbi:GDSL esterase/lipase At4g10955 [Linum perenne]